jgi:CheY-like chemotaxis protein
MMEEALFIARHEKPNLIILDLMMPEIGGYEFMRALQSHADTLCHPDSQNR